jgi:hypothetical protein
MKNAKYQNQIQQQLQWVGVWQSNLKLVLAKQSS